MQCKWLSNRLIDRASMTTSPIMMKLDGPRQALRRLAASPRTPYPQIHGVGSYRGFANFTVWLRQWLSTFGEHQNLSKDIRKHGFLAPVSRVSDSVLLGWGWRICNSDYIPG